MPAFIVYSSLEGGTDRTVIRYGEAPAEDIADQAGSNEIAVAVLASQLDNFYTYARIVEDAPENASGSYVAKIKYYPGDQSFGFFIGSSISSDITVRQQRDILLADSDWTQLADAPLTATKKAQWATYRQALRDISSQPGYPGSVTWPTPPS